MAEAEPSGDEANGQLIPYPLQHGEVILRNGQLGVVYNAKSQQLSVEHIADHAVDLTKCPTCGRPWRDQSQPGASQHDRPSSTRYAEEGRYVDPDYFRLLSASQRSSPLGSVGPSTSRIPPALRSGRSRDVSGAHRPPSGAEFLNSEPTASSQEGISASAFDPGYFKRNFKELKVLGKGGNGVVLLVEHVKDSFSLGQYACKRVPVGNNHDWLLKVLVEVQLLQRLRHPNIVAYYFCWLEDHQSSLFAPKIPCLWMLQEYCDGGDLHSLVLGPTPDDPSTAEKLKNRLRRRSKGEPEPPEDVRSGSKLTLKEIFTFFKDITSGLHYLHGENYLHRDLKPSNCLLRYTKNGPRVMISDFGEVQVAGTKRGSTGATGTISYCAPEVLKMNASDGTYGDFTTKSDVFSLGMIVYFMCFGKLPYVSTDGVDEDNEDLEKLRAEILEWTGFDEQTRARQDLPEQLYRYLKRLLSLNPNERPSTDEIDQSIRGGAGLADASAATFTQETTSRVSSVDSPKRRPSCQGSRQPPAFSRPGLSSIARHRSDDTVRQVVPRSRSRTGSRSGASSKPSSPLEGSMVMRPRRIDTANEIAQEPPQQSPRLLLPPPQEPSSTWSINLHTLVRSTNLLRMAIFFGKVVSITGPCSPYQANPWLLYALLLVAVADLASNERSARWSTLLIALHAFILLLAKQSGRLCQVPIVQWHDL